MTAWWSRALGILWSHLGEKKMERTEGGKRRREGGGS